MLKVILAGGVPESPDRDGAGIGARQCLVPALGAQ